ncbi:DUF5908 family protein [uncultured Chitinophaga sp.]|jgi:hypothetical protein|uniref:DUF5908 family protein n=1 Tax=uncultured Chitinophaga sp. TaxID=339340 RepID=UPI002616D801|nr:DUF5908 family protein [uncultured Chitinophaga sp.]
MPVEIKELVIKAVVNENGNNAAASATAAGQDSGSQDAIIKLCVDKVLEILKDQKER